MEVSGQLHIPAALPLARRETEPSEYEILWFPRAELEVFGDERNL
jgi:hypothetical protein